MSTVDAREREEVGTVVAGRETLATIVKQFKGVKVAVLGDPMLDYYHFGHVDRLSPEAPVPVFIEDKIDLRDGGAANVSANLAALGCYPIQIFPLPPWTLKHRYLVGWQQLFRIDIDRDHLGQLEVPQLAAQGAVEFEEAQALVISDYGRGWCTTERCKRYIGEARKRDIPVIVDPKGLNWAKYEGASIVCPNDHELIQGYDEFAGHILHKQGARGVTLIFPDRTEVQFPARARHVFDVTGAGDTVTAVVAAALAVRCEMPIAAELANIAAGIVVGEVGTTPCTAELLLRELA